MSLLLVITHRATKQTQTQTMLSKPRGWKENKKIMRRHSNATNEASPRPARHTNSPIVHHCCISTIIPSTKASSFNAIPYSRSSSARHYDERRRDKMTRIILRIIPRISVIVILPLQSGDGAQSLDYHFLPNLSRF